MYQIYDITSGVAIFIKSAYQEKGAVELADNLRLQWKNEGMQDRHFKVTYYGETVYSN